MKEAAEKAVVAVFDARFAPLEASLKELHARSDVGLARRGAIHFHAWDVFFLAGAPFY